MTSERPSVVTFSSERSLEISPGPIRGEMQIAVVTLDVLEQMLDGIESLKEIAEAEQEVGVAQQYDFNVSGRQQQMLHDPLNPWIDISVHNPRESDDGDANSNVFVYINRKNLPNPVKVRPGQIGHFNFRTAVIKALWVSCDEVGNSSQGWVIAKF